MRAICIVGLWLVGGCAGMDKVVINEFVSKNVTGFEDNGTHPDWIELYNRGGKPVDLSGWYLTDDRTDPFRWRIPDGIEIDGHGHLLIIADNDPEEGPLHAEFQLDENGEDVGLYGPDDHENPEIDLVRSYPVLGQDVSYARTEDGGDTWKPDKTPTPGKPNR